MQLTQEERDLVVDALGLQIDYVRKTGMFQQTRRKANRCIEREPVDYAPTVEQMEFVVKLDRIKKRLFDGAWPTRKEHQE